MYATDEHKVFRMYKKKKDREMEKAEPKHIKVMTSLMVSKKDLCQYKVHLT